MQREGSGKGFGKTEHFSHLLRVFTVAIKNGGNVMQRAAAGMKIDSVVGHPHKH